MKESELSRPSFNKIYLDFAWALSKRATCKRLQVGCVIVSVDYAYVYGIGYNGGGSGLPNDKCRPEQVGNCGCFVSGTLVRASDVRRAYRRRYKGDVIRIITADSEFTATPNHPVLTTRGWIAAELLQQGDNLLGPALGQGMGVRNPDHQNGVPIEEVFESGRVTSGVVRHTGTSHDFHGDGVVDQQVDVVTINSGLWADREVRATETASQDLFVTSDVVPSKFGSSRPRNALIGDIGGREHSCFDQAVTNHDSANAVPFRDGNNGPSPLVLAQYTGNGQLNHGLSLMSAEVLGHLAQNSALAQAILDGSVGNLAPLSESYHGFSSQVTSNKVINVERNRWTGHVFTLQTFTGWYELAGSNVIVQNCLHSEENACIKCSERRTTPKIVVCTDMPCIMCAQRLLNLGGVVEVVYERPYRLTEGIDTLKRSGIKITPFIRT